VTQCGALGKGTESKAVTQGESASAAQTALAALRQQAITLYQGQRFPEAAQACERILAHTPEDLTALMMLGAITLEGGRAEAAAELFERAARVGSSAHAYNNLGVVYTRLRRHTEALAALERAIALAPDFAEGWCNRGVVLEAQCRNEEALEAVDRALQLDPGHVRAHGNRATVLQNLGRWSEALAGCDAALRLQPRYLPAYSKRAAALLSLHRPEEALRSCEQALALDPHFPPALVNKAAVLRQLLQPQEALAVCAQACRLLPGDPSVHNALGGALADLGRDEEALQSFRQAMALDPDYAEPRWNAATCLLRLGRFREGWPLFEWYRRLPAQPGAHRIPEPRWSGIESLAGRSLYLHAEQGYGDTLQFSRYLTALVERGAAVTFAVQRPLVTLLRGLHAGVAVVAEDEPEPRTDFRLPLLSLPVVLEADLTSIPPPLPLAGDPALLEAWRARLGPRRAPRIGLAWSGNPHHTNDANRSIPLALLLAHLPRGPEYVCLQKDIRGPDRAPLAESAVREFSTMLADFADTAALSRCMDLIVSVDTSIAHLAGTLGLPTCLLLPAVADWRWLMKGTDTAWYESLRLYRQDRPGAWEGPLAQVAQAIRALGG